LEWKKQAAGCITRCGVAMINTIRRRKKMKKCLAVTLTLALLLGIGTVAGAATLKVGLDADPVSLDPQVQLSGGMLQLFPLGI
jgi:hypothetical protein